MNTLGSIHWVRVLIGGFLAEVSLFVIVIPIYMLAGQDVLLYVAPAGSLATCFVFAIWVGRRLESGFVLHGCLVGVVAMLLYVAVTRAQPEPVAYLIAHGLKIAGGAGGGFVGGRRQVSS